MAFQSIHHLPVSGSASIPFRRALSSEPKAAVQILHGLAEYSGRYERFASALSKNGYHTYVQDLRGHGTNITADAPQGCFAAQKGNERVISDVLVLNQHIRQQHFGLPLVLFGHSMGGLIAFNFALAHSAAIDALAVWNTNFGSSIENSLALAYLYSERMLKGSDVPSTLLPRLTFRAWSAEIKDQQTQFDWLSRDSAAVAAYIADPLCGFDASVGLWIDIFKMMNRAKAKSNYSSMRKQLPINLVGGGQDPATNGGMAVRNFASQLSSAGFKNISTMIYDQNRHESLHELNYEEVTKNFLEWLEDMLPSAPFSG